MKRKSMFSILAFLCILTLLVPVSLAQENDEVLHVAVGIVPEATFVEAVAGELADVVIMIPSGNSPANYQPTSKEMQALSDAAVYFTLQMPTEQANILPKVKDFNPDIVIVDLREAVAAQYPLLMMDEDEDHEEAHDETAEDHDHTGVDPHLWLSPKRAIVMVQTIADQLSQRDPSNTDTYQSNATAYIAKLETLDTMIREQTAVLGNQSFMIYHGAYGYFADDYGLTMIAIEIQGKQATAAELQQVIDAARENHITTVFYQAEFDDHQAATVAEEIGGTAAQVAPLSPDYIQSLEDFVSALALSKN
ncbi:MAG TPA: zinc ABC transporter substrate-binding protein [Candidatus Limiplasma sp.]|nr:zinc ABC transporter substrate-binding protein [Candidatus Limiplasma sp.]HRX07968.1 zinc ABC transporter substrate-binding protein [Candidatus Limiplasma sp.]